MEIKIENLFKHYGATCALDTFTVTLQPGVYGLLGPHGAGKSTLMGLLTDTVKRETGSILCHGRDILEMGAAFRELVGYMPQQQGYYEEFSVGRYLHYMASLKGMSRKQAKQEIACAFGGRGSFPLPAQADGQPLRRYAAAHFAGPVPAE